MRNEGFKDILGRTEFQVLTWTSQGGGTVDGFEEVGKLLTWFGGQGGSRGK